MDIEKFEMPALRGARNTIINNRPILAICAYHKRDDIFQIYRYVNSLVDDYKFYFRQHQYNTSELVFYAVPKERSVDQAQ